jgi:hypothetical protein
MTEQAAAPGGDDAAAAAAAAATAEAAAAAAAANPWKDSIAGLSEDDRGYVETKGFSDLTATLSSYRNLETLIGVPKDEILRIPKDGDPELMKAVHAKLGVPADVAGYKDAVITPEGQDPKFRESVLPIFHKANISVDQARVFTDEWNTLMATEAAAAETDYGNQLAAEKVELGKEWGNAYEDKMLQGKHAMEEFGIPSEVIGAIEKQIGFAKTLKVFAKIGAALGEADFVGEGGGSGDSMTPAAAAAELKSLKADPMWVTKYTNGDAAAKATMDKLQRMMNPGE